MMHKIALGIVFGGASSEYEVSLVSASSVLNHIDEDKYDIYKIGITKTGEMYYYTGKVSRIAENKWQGKDCIPCVISPDRSHHGMILFGTAPEVIRLDCVFPVLHGKNGEDGTIQGLLSMAGIPYVGCGYLASAACMDKITAHQILDAAGIRGTKWIGVTNAEYRKDEDRFCEKAETELGFPCFVKPANAGSSVGVTKATKETLKTAMETALANDSRVIVEKAVVGKEIECGVLGNDEPVASCVGEIAPSNDFYDYNAKYVDQKTETFVPARISKESAEEIRKTAVEAFLAIGCRGLSRVDFFLTADNIVFLNEINTIPGFTGISMYPQLFIADGYTYPSLIDRLISFALEDEKKNG